MLSPLIYETRGKFNFICFDHKPQRTLTPFVVIYTVEGEGSRTRIKGQKSDACEDT